MRTLQIIASTVLAAGMALTVPTCVAGETALADASKGGVSKDTEQSVGWRGNWTGKFLDANPPVKWSKLSKEMKGLFCQSTKPKDDKPAGVSASLGALTEWLILGPLSPSGDAKTAIDEEFVTGEANCSPKEGDVVKGVQWKKATVPGSMLNFDTLLAKDMPKGTVVHKSSGKPPYTTPFVAYAHTWVYSPMEATLRFRVRALASMKIYVNGVIQSQQFKIVSQNKAFGGEFSCKLNKGWNQVLCKVLNEFVDENSYYMFSMSSWYLDLGVRAVRPYETESEGIAWATLLPCYHIASPLIVGDKIFAMSRPGDLVCMRKSDGRVLWIRSTTYYDLLSDKDRQANPAFGKVTPLVSELNKIDAAYVEQGTLTEEAIKKRIALHTQIVELMGLADKVRFFGNCGHYTAGNMPTPVSDGKHVYVWSELGIAECFDLNGNRKWIVMPGNRDSDGVGRYCSPVLSAGKMVLFENTLEKHKGGLTALDMDSGAVAWTLPDKNVGEPFSSLVPLKIGAEDCVLYGKFLVHGKDGKVLLENRDDLVCHVPTPVIENGTMYGIKDSSGNVIKAKLGAGNAPMTNEGKLNGLGRICMEPMISSPLYHDGLLYVVDTTGYLYVIDAEAQKIVYQQDLALGKPWPFDFYHAPDWGWDIVYSSPILAGKHIYVFGVNGTAVVFEPGREYKEVAKNKIEDCLLSAMCFDAGKEIPEHFGSSPVAEGKRIYVRGGNYLYCLGEK